MSRPETEIAAHVVEFLREEGWDVGTEVAYEGRTADIVAARPKDVWIVEVKTCRSRTVLAQAERWRGEANAVWVAVPKSKREPPWWWDFKCTNDGLGELTVDNGGVVEIRRSPVRHRLDDMGIRAVLKDGHRDFAPAGNAEGKRWSPFQETASRLREAVLASPGLCLRDFEPDDYKAERLRRLIRNGAIKGLEVRQGGKVYKSGWNRHSVRGCEG